MLQLKDIKKTYVTGELKQEALKGVSIQFRESEFVSILGQSGSGKTTMLNIIGGLDRYTSGDLIINGVSTTKYKDADWDYYRNNSIGFIFQSYNLIPHQSVLANVELALTLAGVSQKERRERAVSVLKKVGLGDHMHKKPNQMSGGQMQRVAIARALVNNPDILLADEPTGALDSDTSVQIMELLKEIAKDRLVIMVTHNPELAQQYSTRIVKLLDGEIISDSNPYEADVQSLVPKEKKKISMSFATALSLSFHNLQTKKGRTLLTSFAGSIGIIGIALILALSTGMSTYITEIQRETMSSYPITISEETIDLTSAIKKRDEMMLDKIESKDREELGNQIYADTFELEANQLMQSNLVENNLAAFKSYLDDPDGEIQEYLGENGIVYSYDVNFSVFSYDEDGRMIWSDADSEDEIESESSQESGMNFSQNMEMMASMFGVSSSAANNFTELIPGSKGETISKVIEENYELVDGSWPDNAYEVVLIVDRNQRISAVTLYQLGLISKETYQKMETQVEEGEEVDAVTLSYDDVKDHTFYLVPACDFYQEVESGTEVPMFRAIEAGTVEEQQLKDNAIELTISGMIRPVEDANNASIMDAVGYTSLLTDVLISHTNESAVVLAQEANPEDNVLNGMKFEEADEETKMAASIGYLQAMGMMELAANSESEFLLSFYDQYIGGATLEDNLEQFGKIYYEVPSSISIYADTFEAKDGIADAITSYNESKSEEEQITYTDYVALLTSSVTSIINGISYVLIAFVAISLVVSCIMIGIITHISVMERTKEIGILRALGASKGNISQVFNAETFIIGCCAGLLGMGISYLLLIPINAVIYRVSQIKGLSAQIPVSAVVILILLSIVITLIGGFIPAKKAAKKDPVIALRTE